MVRLRKRLWRRRLRKLSRNSWICAVLRSKRSNTVQNPNSSFRSIRRCRALTSVISSHNRWDKPVFKASICKIDSSPSSIRVVEQKRTLIRHYTSWVNRKTMMILSQNPWRFSRKICTRRPNSVNKSLKKNRWWRFDLMGPLSWLGQFAARVVLSIRTTNWRSRRISKSGLTTHALA